MASEPLELRPMVKAFAQEMERKLRDNDRKGGWSQESTAYLLSRLVDEVRELHRAVDTYWYFARQSRTSLADPIKLVVLEAADVGNFAAMIADVLGGLQ